MDHGDISDSLFCLGMACAADLPAIIYKRKVKPKDYDPLKSKWSDLPEEDAERRPASHEVEVYSFPQTWGSTALGFGGIGGAAMTTAQTTVCVHHRSAAVYFSRRLAYKVSNINATFMADVHGHNMASCGQAGKY